MTIPCRLSSIGIYVPSHVLSNNDLALEVDTSDQWIWERTGIRQRHLVDKSEQNSDIGFLAAKAALKNSGTSATSLTHAIAATCTPDYLTPSLACVVAGKLGAGSIMAFDIGAACTGFVYGLSICQALLEQNSASKILFICSEVLTRRLNWKDRTTCVLFGDAGTACVVSAEESGPTVIDVICKSDGQQKDLIVIGGGTACEYEIGHAVDEKFFLSMQGQTTYKFAVRNMVDICEELLARNNISISHVDVFVPHQANMRIIEAVGSRLKIPGDKVFSNVKKYGNTSSASIPLALNEALSTNFIKPGSLVLVAAFGGGLTWGAALLRF